MQISTSICEDLTLKKKPLITAAIHSHFSPILRFTYFRGCVNSDVEKKEGAIDRGYTTIIMTAKMNMLYSRKNSWVENMCKYVLNVSCYTPPNTNNQTTSSNFEEDNFQTVLRLNRLYSTYSGLRKYT